VAVGGIRGLTVAGEAGSSRKGLTAGEKFRVKFLPRLSVTLIPNVVATLAVVRVPLKVPDSTCPDSDLTPAEMFPLARVIVYGGVPPIP